MISERQRELLGLVVENYIETMQPIGSRFLTDAGALDVSGATIRNELRALEEAGYLTHPHTSAGRVPTELGYRFYVQEIMQPVALPKKLKDKLEDIRQDAPSETDAMKMAGRLLVELSGNAVILALGKDHMYYTGMSTLFAQPEFVDSARTIEVSAVFDHCEDRLGAVREAIQKETRVLIGQENPLGTACSVVATPLGEHALMLLLGPMRMRYNITVPVMNTLHSLFA